MEIYVAKETQDWLDKIKKINQTWCRQIGEYAFVGDDEKNMVSIKVENLERNLFRWVNGKVIPNQ